MPNFSTICEDLPLAYEGCKAPRVRDRSISMTRPVGKGNEGTCTFNECISMGHGSVRITDRDRESGRQRNEKRTSLIDKKRVCSSGSGKGR